MHAMMEWFSMGGYACYVWSAYGVVGAVFLLNALSCRWQKKRIESSLKNWFKRTSR